VGPRAVLDAVDWRKIPSPRRESNPRTPIVQPVAQRYRIFKKKSTDNFVFNLDSFIWGFVRDFFFGEKVQNANEFRDRTYSVTGNVTNEILPVLSEKLNIVLMCVVPLVVPY
jgi:hypothetical protein